MRKVAISSPLSRWAESDWLLKEGWRCDTLPVTLMNICKNTTVRFLVYGMLNMISHAIINQIGVGVIITVAGTVSKVLRCWADTYSCENPRPAVYLRSPSGNWLSSGSLRSFCLFSSTLIESLKEALLFQVKLLWLVKFPNGKNNKFISHDDWYLVDLLTCPISHRIRVDFNVNYSWNGDTRRSSQIRSQ